MDCSCKDTIEVVTVSKAIGSNGDVFGEKTWKGVFSTWHRITDIIPKVMRLLSLECHVENSNNINWKVIGS